MMSQCCSRSKGKNLFFRDIYKLINYLNAALAVKERITKDYSNYSSVTGCLNAALAAKERIGTVAIARGLLSQCRSRSKGKNLEALSAENVLPITRRQLSQCHSRSKGKNQKNLIWESIYPSLNAALAAKEIILILAPL